MKRIIGKQLVKTILVVALALVLVVIGFFIYLYLSNVERVNAWQKNPATGGQVVEIGSHRAYCVVKGKGRPTVLIEAGLGSGSIEWRKIQEELAQTTRVFAYDRSGYGWSSDSDRKKTAKARIAELRELLSTTNIQAPYILLADSIGALYAQYHARMYPNDIAAVVLIDPASVACEAFRDELPKAVYQNLINKKPRIQAARAVARLGLLRALRALPYERVPSDIQEHLVNFYSAEMTYRTMLSEYEALDDSVRQLSGAGAFPKVPLRVIHHCAKCFVGELLFFSMPYDEAHSIENTWHEINRQTAALSENGSVVYAKRAQRDIHMQEPELIVDTVVHLIRANSQSPRTEPVE